MSYSVPLTLSSLQFQNLLRTTNIRQTTHKFFCTFTGRQFNSSLFDLPTLGKTVTLWSITILYFHYSWLCGQVISRLLLSYTALCTLTQQTKMQQFDWQNGTRNWAFGLTYKSFMLRSYRADSIVSIVVFVLYRVCPFSSNLRSNTGQHRGVFISYRAKYFFNRKENLFVENIDLNPAFT